MRPRHTENELVTRIKKSFPSAKNTSLRLALGDDAALLKSRPGHEEVLTCDWFLEGSHFLRDKHPADAVGWKCLARAVSDIAAMGGAPRCFLLSIALPAELTGRWFEGFLGGLRRASRKLQCELAGGDTTRHERVLINITVIGEVKRGRAVLRSGARPDDLLFVSGTLGEADLGLQLLRKGEGKASKSREALRKHLYPQPRIELGQLLSERGLATSMIDISDGLSTDLARICEASGVGAVVAEDALPWPRGVAEEEGARLALHGGDDYELLFTVRPSRIQIRRLKMALKMIPGPPVTLIGGISKEKILLLSKGKSAVQEILAGGWDPFRE